MIVISMVLVIVAAVTLVIGVFFSAGSNDLSLIYVSIGSCLLAGLFLIIGVLRQRPGRKPVLEAGGEAPPVQPAAPAAWRPSQRWGEQRTAVLERDEEPAQPAWGRAGAERPVIAPEEPEEEAEEAPVTAAVVTPAGEEEEPEAAEDVVVPKPTVPADEAPEPAPGVAAGEPAVAARGRRRAGKKVTKKAAKRAAREAARRAAAEPVDTAPAAEEAAASAAAEPLTAEEAPVSAEPVAEQAAARKAAPAADERIAFTQTLSGVSGLGPAKIRRLATTFGTLEAAQQAKVAELAAVPGISVTLAQRIRRALDEQAATVAAREAEEQKAAVKKTAKRAAVKKAAKKSAAKRIAKRSATKKAAAQIPPEGARPSAPSQAPHVQDDRPEVARFTEALSDVGGLGPAKIRTLAAHFGTMGNLRSATAEDIAGVSGVSAPLAERIHTHLRAAAVEPAEAPGDEQPAEAPREEEPMRMGPTETPTVDISDFEEALSGVSGLGPVKIRYLAGHYATLRDLRLASPAQLAELPGISEALARRIASRLREQG